jgi:Kef-type K+ transport system membrane component KefB
VLGGLLATQIAKDQTFFAPRISTWEAILFMGAAMSITAFPMLARIIYERGLSGTSLGTLALAAGSMDDAAAWCILAVVLASFGHKPSIALWAIGGGLFYVMVVLFARRFLLHKIAEHVERQGELHGTTLALVLMLLMLGAWFTDAVGIYAVFGAFILGASMPRGLLTERLKSFIEPLTTNFMLPLFFIYSGLNTKIGLVSTASLLLVALLILLIACAGKGIACYLAARLNGEDNRNAAAIGTLMNARGLMELIILNIGLERGLITPTLFTIMVIMAIVTTLMATPIFNLVSSWSRTPLTMKKSVPSAVAGG